MQYDEKTLKKLQKTLKEMLKDLDEVCTRHDIQYFVAFGTAIGAIRHQGFIPWDDDIDIGMLRDDFDRFLQVAEVELRDKYYLLSPAFCPDCTSPMTKLVLKDTLYVSEDVKDMPHEQGIYIDIFPYDRLATSKIGRIRQIQLTTILDRLIFLRGNGHPVIPYKGWKKKVYAGICQCIHFALKLFRVSPAFLFELFEKESTRYRNNGCKWVTNLGRNTAMKKLENSRELVPTSSVPFEDITVQVAGNVTKSLTRYYGDFMKVPPKEEQINHCPLILKFPGEDPIYFD